jgi:hypothetical protein
MPDGKYVYFEPTGEPSKEWRELMVEVSPSGVRGTWDGKSMGLLTGEQLVDRSNKILRDLRKNLPEPPFGKDLQFVYSPRGGLGLYVQNGTAAYRRVVIEPLEDTE